MSATLINPAAHWVDDGESGQSAIPMSLFPAATPGHYVFATRGRYPAGSLVPRAGGGYVLTIGVLSGSGIAAKLTNGVVVF